MVIKSRRSHYYKDAVVLFYLFFWLFWLFYNSVLRNLTLNSTTYFAIFTSLFMFLIGYFLSRNIKNREIQLKSNPKPKIRKLFYLIFTLNLILSLISIFSIFINGWETRDLVFNDNGIYNSFSVNIIVNFLIYPLTLACIIFFSLV